MTVSYSGAMSFPSEQQQQYRLDDLTRSAGAAAPPPARRGGAWIALIVVSGVALVAVTAVAVLLLTGRDPSGTSGSSVATPESNGIKRPDPSCVTTTDTDHSDMWDANGWWAGRVDGEAREMPALTVLQLKLDGHQISSAWICAPRSTS